MAQDKAVIDDLWWSSKPDPETGKKRKLKAHGKGSRWRVRWIDPYTRETRTEAIERKPDAERLAASLTTAINEGRYIDPAAGRITVADYADKWITGLQLRQGSIDLIEGNLRNHVKPEIGHMAAAAVQPTTIRTWVAAMRAKGLSATTIRGIYGGIVTPLFGQMVIDGVRGRTPCVGVKLPELSSGEYDLPTADEVLAITASMDAAYLPVAPLAAGCGLRQGEIFGLELDAVDLDRRTVEVRQQVVQSTAGIYIGPPKTKTSARTVELPKIAVEALRKHIERFPPKPVTVMDRTGPDKPTERKALLLFPDDRGGLMRRSRWSQNFWQPTIARAGIAAGRFGLHSLRHYFATVLIFAGAHVKNVQLSLGHAKASVTLDTYLGYWPDDEVERSRSLIDTALGTALPPSRADL